MLIVFVRSLILYSLIIFIMRLMGKKQIGQLQPSELVVALVIADLASVPMANIEIPLIYGIIPIITLYICEELISYISMLNGKARGIICGKPSILIEKGVIMESELRKERYNINDLLEQLRLKDYTKVDDIEYAILETCGQVSVIAKSQNKPPTRSDMGIHIRQEEIPISLIIDGEINYLNLRISNLTTDWLNSELKRYNIKSEKQIFFAYITSDNKLHYQLKEKYRKGEAK